MRLRRFLRNTALLAVALAALLAALAVSGEPAVPPRRAPSAAEMAAGQDALRQLESVRETGRGTIRLDAAALNGLAAIASRAAGVERFRFDLRPDRVVAAGSQELVLGLWANFTVSALADGPGPPQMTVAVGRLTIPRWATPLGLKAARRILRFRGADVPPLDEMVRTLAITRGGLSADVRLPPGADVASALAQLRPTGVDADLVLRSWCRLAEAQRRDPETSLAEQVRRSFSSPDDAGTPAANKAAMIALAMLTVDVRVGELAGLSRSRAAACAGRARPIRLAGREDLAKHWALSAALAAALGFDAAQAAGQYKELADSGSGGSGFSFVDLAADRAGLRAAREAFQPRTAASTARILAAATEEDLLPPELMSLPEDLSDARFAERYGSQQDERFRAAVRSIDVALDRIWGRLAGRRRGS
jgi:uncharacterized protein YfiM (DUF2279 family)